MPSGLHAGAESAKDADAGAVVEAALEVALMGLFPLWAACIVGMANRPAGDCNLGLGFSMLRKSVPLSSFLDFLALFALGKFGALR